MFFTYKPTKFRTHGRLPQSPKKPIRLKRKTARLAGSRFALQSLVRH